MKNESSVLEKLNYCEDILELRRDYLVDNYYEDEDVEKVQQCLNIIPRLIAALEMVESKAKQPVEPGVHYGFGFVAGRIDFAREVLAVLNNKDNKEAQGESPQV